MAAIDVYEDGEAGLLLCYNCKYLGKTKNGNTSNLLVSFVFHWSLISILK